MPYDGKKKKIMRSFKLSEISGVDMPAQSGAQVKLIKRNEKWQVSFIKDEKGDIAKLAVLTSAADGHTHLITIGEYEMREGGGHTGYGGLNATDGSQEVHSHPFVIDAEGIVRIGESNGHTHMTADVGTGSRNGDTDQGEPQPIPLLRDVNMAVEARTFEAVEKYAGFENVSLDSLETFAAKMLCASEGRNQETDGEPVVFKFNGKEYEKQEDYEAAVRADVEKSAEQKDHELAVAKAYGELSDSEKAFCKGMGNDEREAFVLSAPQLRKEQIEKAEAKDKVIYKAADGTEYRASDDPRLVQMAKRDDQREAELAKLRDTTIQNTYEKRAAEELAHLPGSPAENAELLKAVDLIENEDLRKKALQNLHAQNEAMAKAFTTAGTSHVPAAGSAEDKLEAGVRKFAKENNVEMHQAYAQYLETPEGAQLYEETQSH